MTTPDYQPTEAERQLREETARDALDAREVRGQEEAAHAASWRPEDLEDALAGHRDAAPTILRRLDGMHLVYEGRTHWVMGEPESLKSWIAQLAVAQVLSEEGHVLYVDYEDTKYSVVQRLLSLGVAPDDIRDYLSYLRPTSYLGGGRDRVTMGELAFQETLDATDYRLAVLDGVTESMTMETLELRENTAVAEWMQRIPRRMANTGAAVICIDHVTKDSETRGRYAIGGSHKLAAVDGAALSVELVRPLSRPSDATGDVTGVARINVQKDRPGWVRSVSITERLVGVFQITAKVNGDIEAHILTDEEADLRQAMPDHCLEVAQAIKDKPKPLTERRVLDWMDAVGVSERETRAALRWLSAEGWITEGATAQGWPLWEMTEHGESEVAQ